jgi:hypothetical protein
VAELGIEEADAARLSSAFIAEGYFPVRDETGFIEGFIGYAKDSFYVPKDWQTQHKVVKLKRA